MVLSIETGVTFLFPLVPAAGGGWPLFRFCKFVTSVPPCWWPALVDQTVTTSPSGGDSGTSLPFTHPMSLGETVVGMSLHVENLTGGYIRFKR